MTRPADGGNSHNKKNMDQHFSKDGIYYLFSLRLLPLIPFFIVNLVMGVTSVRIKTFFWVSQLGMLPATLLFTNAGSQLNNINSIIVGGSSKSHLSETLEIINNSYSN